MSCQSLRRASICLATLVVACGLSAACGSSAVAQEVSGAQNVPPRVEPPPQPAADDLFQPVQSTVRTPAAADSARRDPTQASAELRELMASDSAKGPAVVQVPALTIRGLVIGSKGDPAAVLAIGEKTSVVVRAGHQYVIGGSTANAPHVIILVARITAEQVEVEILPGRQKLILH